MEEVTRDRLETSQRLVERLNVANAERESLSSETTRLREEVGAVRSRLITAERGADEVGDLHPRLATAEERGSQEVADLQVRVATAKREAHDAREMRTRLAKAERLAQESMELRMRLATAEHEAQACSELRRRLAMSECGAHELGELRVRLAAAERGAQDANAFRVRLAAAEREAQDTGELRVRLSTLEHGTQEAGELRIRLAAAEPSLQEVAFLRNRLMIRDADGSRLERRFADLEGTSSGFACIDSRVTLAIDGNVPSAPLQERVQHRNVEGLGVIPQLRVQHWTAEPVVDVPVPMAEEAAAHGVDGSVVALPASAAPEPCRVFGATEYTSSVHESRCFGAIGVLEFIGRRRLVG
eukprot:TRINITY_DN16498_c0_g2_i1.p1 TRINITY_DN16498_c0_g2~~TRINITY_DN16498_c0_g2_i1.p1  ORF type:complete len:380 (-),score=70.20 TRINITY_DN16498_c0_g2_i1:249-1319(-)